MEHFLATKKSKKKTRKIIHFKGGGGGRGWSRPIWKKFTFRFFFWEAPPGGSYFSASYRFHSLHSSIMYSLFSDIPSNLFFAKIWCSLLHWEGQCPSFKFGTIISTSMGSTELKSRFPLHSSAKNNPKYLGRSRKKNRHLKKFSCILHITGIPVVHSIWQKQAATWLIYLGPPRFLEILNPS